ncbi:hypothetical protein RND81_13G021900 [Saponaria officinalis]|uniref:CCD97-like C-terminal domain-containing protein n=1 Tax=Saponaria officinalis TaxID=3572 RepID=A0AAW1GTF7_SAPOF
MRNRRSVQTIIDRPKRYSVYSERSEIKREGAEAHKSQNREKKRNIKKMEEDRKTVSIEAKEKISERLSSFDNLYFPRALLPRASTPSLRKSLLLDLLSRDVAVFLERYGPQLTSQELQEFDVLKDDYEINWHIKHLRSLLSPTSEQRRLQSLTIKNRRRAYMDKLVSEGNYFSEDAMREREPYLHHEYLGKFQDPYGRSMARPGERWSDTLMRRAEEAILVRKIRSEQQRLGVHESEWVGYERAIDLEEEEEMEEEEEDDEEEEEDEDEDSEEDDSDTDNVNDNKISSSSQVGPVNGQSEATDGVPSTSSRQVERPTLSPTEMQEQLDQFTYIMQQKFLSGQDKEHFNYSKIDEDQTLDDHWIKEANHDAEEKYFAED